MDLTGISKYGDLLNIRGAIQIEYLPIEWVKKSTYSEFPTATYNHPTIETITDRTWLKCYVLVGDRTWSESNSNTVHGEISDLAVNAMLPMHTAALSQELMRTAKHRFLVRLTDMSEQQWIIGTLQMPLSFNSTYDSKTATHQIKWMGKQRRRALGLPFNALPNPGQIIEIEVPGGLPGNLRYQIMESTTGLSGSTHTFATTLPTAQSWFVLRNKTVHYPSVSAGVMTFVPALAAWELLELVFLKAD